MKIQESAENYLEAIFVLSKSGSPVRSVDVATRLGYSKPSVSVAMKKLKIEGYVVIASNGHLMLTQMGRDIAESMYERHMLISDWLVALGVDSQVATDDACRIEHVISEESFEALRRHIKLL